MLDIGNLWEYNLYVIGIYSVWDVPCLFFFDGI